MRGIRDLLILVILALGPLVLTLARIYEQSTLGHGTAAAIRGATPWAGAMCLGLAGGSLLAVITSRIFHLDSVIRWSDCAFASFTLWSAVLLLLPTLSSDQVTPFVIGLIVAVFASGAAVVVRLYQKSRKEGQESEAREAAAMPERKRQSPKNPTSGQR